MPQQWKQPRGYGLDCSKVKFTTLNSALADLTDDPLRIHILLAHNFIEETIEDLIAEAVPNSECFNVPKMRFVDKLQVARKIDGEHGNEEVWSIIRALNDLRAAAAHRNYEQKRDECFVKLADKIWIISDNHELIKN